MSKQAPYYCPLHGIKLKGETKPIQEGVAYVSKAICYDKSDDFKHTVIIEDRQAFEQEGVITVVLS